MFIVGAAGGGDVNEYTLSTGFDVSTASFVDSFRCFFTRFSPRGLHLILDGTKCLLLVLMEMTVYQYTLSTGLMFQLRQFCK
jgi:hypothetical protein